MILFYLIYYQQNASQFYENAVIYWRQQKR
jgi:hypothetical protein